MKSFSYKTELLATETGIPDVAGIDPVCAFTVDVEDWYQSCVDFDAPIAEGVGDNVKRILDLLDKCSVKGTFFVQGMVAEKFPGLMQQLVAGGHEIQSHGYSHRPLHKMSRLELQSELEKARKSVEDACGIAVTAFRAPDFTILSENLWALEVLAEAGFKIDSSIFPMKTRRYGIDDWDLHPQKITFAGGAEILEIPVAVLEKFGYRLPVAGGGYFRLFPDFVLKWAIRDIIARGCPAIIYCHPYEFNASELEKYKGSSPSLFRLQQGIGRANFPRRMEDFLDSFQFGRLDDVLKTWKII